jgi:phenylacetate-CoA ligase
MEGSAFRRALATSAWHVHPGPRGRAYRFLQRSQWASPDELREIQLAALNNVLSAARSIPFYRERLQGASVGPRGVTSLEDLARLPPLERADIQRLGIRGLRGPGLIYLRRRTSGSTGQPVEVRWSREMMAWVDAANRRSLEWLGVRPGDRRVNVRQPSSTRLRRLRRVAFNSARIFPKALFDPQYREDAIAALRRNPPMMVMGNTKSVQVLALALEGSAPIEAGAVVTGAGALHEHYKHVMERAFRCPVYNRYGAIETGQIAHPCGEAGLRHIPSEVLLLEVVREDGSPAEPGELGDVLVTCLRNRAMPLIRYRLGDRAAVTDAPCPCGRGLPVLESLVGRTNEVLIRPDGGVVLPGAMVDKLMEVAGSSLLEFKIIQQADLSVQILAVQRAEPNPEDVRRRLAAAFDELIGAPEGTEVKRVDDLPADRAEKLQVIVSHALDRDRTATFSDAARQALRQTS